MTVSPGSDAHIDDAMIETLGRGLEMGIASAHGVVMTPGERFTAPR